MTDESQSDAEDDLQQDVAYWRSLAIYMALFNIFTVTVTVLGLAMLTGVTCK